MNTKCVYEVRAAHGDYVTLEVDDRVAFNHYVVACRFYAPAVLTEIRPDGSRVELSLFESGTENNS